MPNCFTLTPIGATEPATLASIDEALCAHLGVPVHPSQYHARWVDLEGFALAMGKDWNWMRENFDGREPIISWLESNYTVDAFAYR